MSRPSESGRSSLLDLSPVIPVVVVDELQAAVPLAQALVDGGIGVIEVTLRTDVALDAIRAIAESVPDITIGAGTVVTPRHATAAAEAGADFLVSPGTTSGLLEAMRSTGLPVLPGAATVSEVLALVEEGVTELKFFPAEASGGARFLEALASPLPMARFCPTGGITAASARDYLALPNVGCVGGTWISAAPLLAARDWPGVRALAEAAARLRGPDGAASQGVVGVVAP